MIEQQSRAILKLPSKKERSAVQVGWRLRCSQILCRHPLPTHCFSTHRLALSQLPCSWHACTLRAAGRLLHTALPQALEAVLAQERQDAAAKDARHKLTVERLRRQLADLQVGRQLASTMYHSIIGTLQEPQSGTHSLTSQTALPARWPCTLLCYHGA